MRSGIFARDGRRRPPQLSQAARDAIYDHVYGGQDHEVGGVLLGRRGGRSRSVRVTDTIRADQASEARSSVTFTHETWQAIHRELDRRDAETIVGWYHSHPGLGPCISHHDRFIHQHFFSDPNQVALVVDPVADREQWFGWHRGEISALTGARGTTRPNPQAEFWADEDGAQAGIEVRAWLERAGYACLGVIVGVAFWAAVLRKDGHAPATSTVREAQPTATHARPIVLEPQAGQQGNSGTAQGNTGSAP